MTKELILKLIDRARQAGDNAYCPYTNTPIGCALLTEENVIFSGCNIESRVLSCSMNAGEVAMAKAISEGYTRFSAVCFYSDDIMPFPDGRVCQLVADFAQTIRVVVANKDSYNLHFLYELFPFSPQLPEVD